MAFDKDTLLPIKDAEIGLYNSKDNKLIKSVFTNKDGQYSLKVEKGEYYILIRHDNYEFFNNTSDINAYKGEIFKFESDKYLWFDFALKKNKDFMVVNKDNRKSYNKLIKFLQKIYPYILFALLVINIVFYLLTKELAYLLLSLYHFLIIIYYLFLINKYKHKNLFCYDSEDEKGIENTMIKVTNLLEDGYIVHSKISSPDGSYGLLLPKGKYQIVIHSKEYTFPSKIDKKMQDKKEGIFVLDTRKKTEEYIGLPLDKATN